MVGRIVYGVVALITFASVVTMWTSDLIPGRLTLTAWAIVVIWFWAEKAMTTHHPLKCVGCGRGGFDDETITHKSGCRYT